MFLSIRNNCLLKVSLQLNDHPSKKDEYDTTTTHCLLLPFSLNITYFRVKIGLLVDFFIQKSNRNTCLLLGGTFNGSVTFKRQLKTNQT